MHLWNVLYVNISLRFVLESIKDINFLMFNFGIISSYS